ncbi:IS3 family transposase [Brevibacillus gelatini]|uniref:IS3 family transposase n=1 Tax=Brevibacillus gelatini TaxID=1655277 RepID=UPI003D817757
MVSRNKSFSMVCTSSMVRQSFANSLIVMSLLSCINDHLLNGKFNHLHKTFYALQMNFQSLRHLELELSDYVNWFNKHRIHGTLGYMTPVQYRQEALIKIV